MDGLILAAGFGRRLGELGRETPKALLEVGGRTMLEHVARALVRAGVDRIIVNVHHHAGQIARYVDERDLGVEIVLSHEVDRPLETGGAILHAAPLLRGDGPFLVHNVDVLTDADLGMLVRAHVEAGEDAGGPGHAEEGGRRPPIATLAVQERATSRHLLFDDVGLFGRSDERAGERIEARPPVGEERRWAFAGVHVLSADLPSRLTERGAFPILQAYLRLVGEGGIIRPHPIGGARWLEVGSPERLQRAREVLRSEGAEGLST